MPIIKNPEGGIILDESEWMSPFKKHAMEKVREMEEKRKAQNKEENRKK